MDIATYMFTLNQFWKNLYVFIDFKFADDILFVPQQLGLCESISSLFIYTISRSIIDWFQYTSYYYLGALDKNISSFKFVKDWVLVGYLTWDDKRLTSLQQ